MSAAHCLKTSLDRAATLIEIARQEQLNERMAAVIAAIEDALRNARSYINEIEDTPLA